MPRTQDHELRIDGVFSLLDVIQVLDAYRREGVLHVDSGEDRGTVNMEGGRIVDAALGRPGAGDGEDALVEMLRWPVTQVRFDACTVSAGRRTVDRPTTEVLLAVLQRIDEANEVAVADNVRTFPHARRMEITIDEPLQLLVTELRSRIPGGVAAGLFNYADGLMLAVDSAVPDTRMDEMSAIHERIWARIEEFIAHLPAPIVGELCSLTLEVEGASFFIDLDNRAKLAAMGAYAGDGSLGLTRLLVRRHLSRAVQILGADSE